MTEITIRIVNGRNFSKAVKQVKGMGGKYDPVSQTWTFSIDERTREFTANPAFFVEVGRRLVGDAAQVQGSAREQLERLGAEAAEGDFGLDHIDM